MLDDIIALCTSGSGLAWIVIGSDIAIAAAYLAIPITMAVVFRRHRKDIPLPWLWRLFVAFIAACALTHLAHAFSSVTGYELLGTRGLLGLFCAAVSVGTAIAFAWFLPDIKKMPSPKETQMALEQAVAQRTEELNGLVHEIHHRLGNQLQILTSALNIEERKVSSEDAATVVARLRSVTEQLSEDYLRRSETDYSHRATWYADRRRQA